MWVRMSLGKRFLFGTLLAFAAGGLAGAQSGGPAADSGPIALAKVQSSPLPARLSDVEGTVGIGQATAETSATPASHSLPPPPPPDQLFPQASLNMPVLAGMQVETGDGRAEMQFNDGAVGRAGFA